MDVGAFLAARKRSSPYCVTLSTTFDHDTSGSWMSITDLSDLNDPWGLHDNTSDRERVVLPHEGLYLFNSNIVFPANATGQRGVRIRNSAGTTIAVVEQDAAAAGTTSMVLSGLSYATGTFLDVQAFQSSTGTLSNLQVIFSVALLQ